MNDNKTSLVATSIVILAVAAAVGGSAMRDRLEAGPRVAFRSPVGAGGIVAHNDGKRDDTDIAPQPDVSTYFYQLSEILDKNYVEPITDGQSLAVGAVRGMVMSLRDPYSVFYKPDQMRAMTDLQKGTYSGIGVEVRYDFGSDDDSLAASDNPDFHYPSVIVSSVAAGGPADKAGMKAGARIVRVNGKWVPSYHEIDEVREIRKSLDDGRTSSEQFEKSVARFREMFENSASPNRVSDEIATGTSGTVNVSWIGSDDKEESATIERRQTTERAVTVYDDTLRLKFYEGADAALAREVKGKTEIVIDLRGSTMGDYDAMRACLDLLAPAGKIGEIRRTRAGLPREVSLSQGISTPIKLNLIVDKTTRGAAQVFAQALVGSGVAKVVQGSLAESAPWIETTLLPDGSGYTLRTGTFVASGGGKQ